MRRLALVLVLASFAACSDDPKDPQQDATETTPEVTPDTEDEVDTTPEVDEEVDSDTDDEVNACEHPCLDDFGKNDKRLCPAPQSEWVCTEGCCVPVFKCTADADCTTRGFTEGQCKDDRFACHCNSGGDVVAPRGVEVGQCFTWFCAVAADCGDGEICAGGTCVAAPDDKSLAVRILDRQTVLVTGASYQLHAEAFDPADTDIVLGATPTWSSSNDSVAS